MSGPISTTLRLLGQPDKEEQAQVRQDNKMMVPSLPSVILTRSMRRNDKKMGSSKARANHSLREGFWRESFLEWKWLNMISMPVALVFVAIMVVVEAINGNLEKGVTLGLMFIAIAEIACTFMTFFTQIMISIFDLIDR